MKHINKQNLTLNALLVLLLALFFLAGLLMWSQYHQYHNHQYHNNSGKQTLWMGQEQSQEKTSEMEDNHSIKERKHKMLIFTFANIVC